MQNRKEKTVNLILCGTLESANYEKKKTQDGREFLKGVMTLSTPNGLTVVDFFTSKLKKDGAVSNLFLGMEDAFHQYTTGDRVSIAGDIKDQIYVTKDGIEASRITLEGRFVNTPYESTQDASTMEINRGIVLGGFKRSKTEGDWILPVGFQIGDNPNYLQMGVVDAIFSDDTYQAVKSIFTPGTTISLNLNICGISNVETIVVENAFGPNTVKQGKREYKVEYRAFSGSKINGARAYREDEIEALVANRKEMIEKAKAKANAKTTQSAPAPTAAPTVKKDFKNYL